MTPSHKLDILKSRVERLNQLSARLQTIATEMRQSTSLVTILNERAQREAERVRGGSGSQPPKPAAARALSEVARRVKAASKAIGLRHRTVVVLQHRASRFLDYPERTLRNPRDRTVDRNLDGLIRKKPARNVVRVRPLQSLKAMV